jgi:hypothetical protein
MELTLERFKKYIPKVILSDEDIVRYLNDSKRNVIRDGFDVSHEDFDELQRLHCLGILQLEDVKGINSAGFGGNSTDKKISSFNVSGISVSYANNSANGAFISKTTGRSGYLGQYDELVRTLRGVAVIIE